MEGGAVEFVLRDVQTGRGYPVPSAGLRIGRAADNALVLTDPYASRHHATVWTQGGQLHIRDEQSVAGTWVNERRMVGSAPLHVGDRVRIGGTVFEVTTSGALPLPMAVAVPARTSMPVVPIAIAGIVVLLILIALLARSTGKPTALPTAIPTPTLAATPLIPTDSSSPAPTKTPTVMPTHVAPATTPPSARPVPTTPPAVPSSSSVVPIFLADARQTQDDLMEIKVWFDRLAGGENIPCNTVYGHTIHQPSSTAPAQVADLVPTWNEYQTALAEGQQCLQWLVDFCHAGGGVIDETTFWDRRALSSSALSHCEHVVQSLEEM